MYTVKKTNFYGFCFCLYFNFPHVMENIIFHIWNAQDFHENYTENLQCRITFHFVFPLS